MNRSEVVFRRKLKLDLSLHKPLANISRASSAERTVQPAADICYHMRYTLCSKHNFERNARLLTDTVDNGGPVLRWHRPPPRSTMFKRLASGLTFIQSNADTTTALPYTIIYPVSAPFCTSNSSTQPTTFNFPVPRGKRHHVARVSGIGSALELSLRLPRILFRQRPFRHAVISSPSS